MLSIYLSKKISFFSFGLMVLVVILHSQNINNRIYEFHQTEGWNYLIQTFISGGICQIAVPMFFVISGFLFFYGFQFNVHNYKAKIRKKVKTLVIPYILTSFFGLAIFFILQIPEKGKSFFNHKLISEYNFAEILNSIFLYPLPYQLWFLRNLIIINLILTPGIYYLPKKFKKFLVFFLLSVWLVYPQSLGFGTLISITFFVLGAYVALNDISPCIFVKGKKLVLMITTWIVLIIMQIIFSTVDTILNSVIQNVSVVIGMISVSSLYDWLSAKGCNFDIPTRLAKFSFFIYLFHEPLLTCIIKTGFFLLGRNSWSSIITYIFSPILTILICLMIAYLLKKHMTSLYNLICGYRK